MFEDTCTVAKPTEAGKENRRLKVSSLTVQSKEAEEESGANTPQSLGSTGALPNPKGQSPYPTLTEGGGKVRNWRPEGEVGKTLTLASLYLCVHLSNLFFEIRSHSPG